MLYKESNVNIDYVNEETYFAMSFSRTDRNIVTSDDTINGTINKLENEVLNYLRKDNNATALELVKKCNVTIRTINRTISSLKEKGLITRIGSNKTGYRKAK